MLKKETKLKNYLFIVLLVVLDASCAKKPAEVDITGLNTPEVLAKVKQAQENAKSLKGLARVMIISPDTKLSFNQVTIVERPNLMRLQALAPFGKTALLVISDGKKISIASPKAKQVMKGTDEFDLSSLYPGFALKISSNNLVNLLLGRLPQEIAYNPAQAKLSVEAPYLVLNIPDSKGENTLWVNPSTYVVEKAKIKTTSGTEVNCKFEDFKDLGTGSPFPTKIELQSADLLISLKYDDKIQVNSTIDQTLFQPDTPQAMLDN